MLKRLECFEPEKVMKIHRMIREHELYTSIKEHRPNGCEEIMYFVSRCLEIRRKQSIFENLHRI